MNTHIMPQAYLGYQVQQQQPYNMRTMDYATYRNNISDPVRIAEPEVSYQIERSLLHVSSQFRDRTFHPDAGSFKVDLTNPYDDVIAIELVGGVIPYRPTLTANPYIILDMGREMENVQTLSGDSYFAILNVFSHSSGGTYLTIDRSNTEGKPKTFSPPLRRLTSLQVRLLYPDGTQVRFVDEPPNTAMDFANQVSLTFQIHQRVRRKSGIERDAKNVQF